MAYHIPADAIPLRPMSPAQQTAQSKDVKRDVGSETANNGNGSNNRRRSSTKMAGLTRAFSSPNVRGLASVENAPLSPIDKKRNKLGYHRTAVACGHCRRRKIRCITANEDTNGRCQNCIRLKKDCYFFPVDQPGPSPGRQARSESKTEGNITEGGESVASSSPRILASHSVDQIKNVSVQIGTPPLTDDGSTYHSFRPSSNLGGPSEFGAPHEYDYRHPYDVPPQALYQYQGHPQDVHGSERTHFDATPGHYYSSQSPYTSPPLSGSFKTSPQANTRQFQQPSAQSSDFGWTHHPSVRSMSIADTEDLRSMYPAYRSNTFPSIPHRVGSSAAISQFPPDHPGFIQPGSQHSSYSSQFSPSGYQQMHVPSTMAWSSSIPTQMTPVPSSSSDGYHAGWYTAPSNLPYVREEDDSAHGIHPHIHDQQRFRPNPG